MSALPRRGDPPTLPTVTEVPRALEPITRDPFIEGVGEAVPPSAPVAALVKPRVDPRDEPVAGRPGPARIDEPTSAGVRDEYG